MRLVQFLITSEFDSLDYLSCVFDFFLQIITFWTVSNKKLNYFEKEILKRNQLYHSSLTKTFKTILLTDHNPWNKTDNIYFGDFLKCQTSSFEKTKDWYQSNESIFISFSRYRTSIAHPPESQISFKMMR